MVRKTAAATKGAGKVACLVCLGRRWGPEAHDARRRSDSTAHAEKGLPLMCGRKRIDGAVGEFGGLLKAENGLRNAETGNGLTGSSGLNRRRRRRYF